MATLSNYESRLRWERFVRLERAYFAAMRWELRRSAMLFHDKLQTLGAWQDIDGQWHYVDPPAAGSSQPY